MNRQTLESLLNHKLHSKLIKDYCPNGLQIQGTDSIKKIVTGVTASQALIDKAIERKADAIIVHHGYFWKGEDYVIKGMKYNRIKSLINNEINLFAYHLPLDVHSTLGNNAQLANLLGIKNAAPVLSVEPQGVLMSGELELPIDATEFKHLINKCLNREPIHILSTSNKKIKTLAWCTGGGQSFIDAAVEQGVDAYISGEISEQTTHVARELDIHFFAAGHHATERYGIKALTEYLVREHQLDAEFIDIDNPA